LSFSLPIPDAFKSHDAWLVGLADGLGLKRVEKCTLQFYRRHGNNESSFIANRIKKVNKIQSFIYMLNKNFAKNNLSHFEFRINQLEILHSGLVRAKNMAPRKLLPELDEFSSRLEVNIASQKTRLNIREKSLFPRVAAVIAFWSKGGYLKMNSIKSMVRDILG
jgi:hypothetical protein